jgi:hypothetical protein
MQGEMKSENPYFWAKTTEDGQPGISVRDHCLNVGCVAEALILALPKPLQELLPPDAARTRASTHDLRAVREGFRRRPFGDRCKISSSGIVNPALCSLIASLKSLSNGPPGRASSSIS